MTEKIIIAVADATTGENTVEELTGTKLQEFLDKRNELELLEIAKTEKIKTQRENTLKKLESLGLTLEDLRVLGLVEQPTQPIGGNN